MVDPYQPHPDAPQPSGAYPPPAAAQPGFQPGYQPASAAQPGYQPAGAAQPGAQPGGAPQGYPVAPPPMPYAQAAYGDPRFVFDPAQGPDDLARPLYGAGFTVAVRRFFRQYATFTGRASRSEYWFAYLFMALVQFIPGVLMGIGWVMMIAGSVDSYYYDDPAWSALPGFGALVLGCVLFGVLGLAMLVPNLALCWRRLHDSNQPGPMYFLGCIPYVGGIILLVLMAMPSKPEGRRFDLPR